MNFTHLEVRYDNINLLYREKVEKIEEMLQENNESKEQ